MRLVFLLLTSLLVLANPGQGAKKMPPLSKNLGITTAVRKSFDLEFYLFSTVRHIKELHQVYTQVIDKCRAEANMWLTRYYATMLTQEAGESKVDVFKPIEFFDGCTANKFFVAKAVGEIPEDEEHSKSVKEVQECVVKQNKLVEGDYVALAKRLKEDKACGPHD